MGLDLYLRNNQHVGHLGYGHYFSMRDEIASAFGLEGWGEYYRNQIGNFNNFKDYEYPEDTSPTLIKFLEHSDCDGSINYSDCKKIYSLLRKTGIRLRTKEEELDIFAGALLKAIDHKSKLYYG